MKDELRKNFYDLPDREELEDWFNDFGEPEDLALNLHDSSIITAAIEGRRFTIRVCLCNMYAPLEESMRNVRNPFIVDLILNGVAEEELKQFDGFDFFMADIDGHPICKNEGSFFFRENHDPDAILCPTLHYEKCYVEVLGEMDDDVFGDAINTGVLPYEQRHPLMKI